MARSHAERVKMALMIEWKERSHEADGDNMTLATLWECGLLKFFHCPLLGSHEYLLDQLV
jgi:hypothetical protein